MIPGSRYRHDAWSDWELSVLYEFVNDEDWLDEACRLLLGRTRNAIQQKMSALRREAGIVPKHRGAKAMSERNANRVAVTKASEKLKRALEELAA